MDLQKTFLRTLKTELEPLVDHFPDSKVATYYNTLDEAAYKTWEANLEPVYRDIVDGNVRVFDQPLLKELEFQKLYESFEQEDEKKQFFQLLRNVACGIVVGQVCSTVPSISGDMRALREKNPDVTMSEAIDSLLSSDGVSNLCKSFSNPKTMKKMTQKIKLLIELRGNGNDELIQSLDGINPDGMNISAKDIQDQLAVLQQSPELMKMLTGQSKGGFDFKSVLGMLSNVQK